MAVRELDPDAKMLVSKDFHLSDPMLALSVRSQPVRQRADVSSYVSGGKININIPPIAYDGRKSYLTFNGVVTPSTVPNTYDRFPAPIQSIFSRARVYIGSTLVEDIEQYSLLIGILSQGWESGLVSGVTNGMGMEGYFSQAQRTANSIIPIKYSCELQLDSLKRYIPLDLLNQGLRIELQLADNAACLESDSGAPDATYTISEVYYSYHKLTLDRDFEDIVKQHINSGRFVIPYRSWSHFSSTFAGTSYNQELPLRFKNINRILAVNRLDANVNSYATNDKTTLYPAFSGSSLSLLVNNVRYPEDGNDGLGTDTAKWTLFRDFMDTINQWSKARDRNFNCLAAVSWTSRTVMAFDLREDRNDETDVYENGPDTSQAGASCVLRFNLTGAYASTALMSAYGQYEGAIKVSSGGRVQVVF